MRAIVSIEDGRREIEEHEEMKEHIRNGLIRIREKLDRIESAMMSYADGNEYMALIAIRCLDSSMTMAEQIVVNGTECDVSASASGSNK